MTTSANDRQQIAAQLLAGLLANPHVYASVSDEGAAGQQEQKLLGMAIEMTETLIEKVEYKEGTER